MRRGGRPVQQPFVGRTIVIPVAQAAVWTPENYRPRVKQQLRARRRPLFWEPGWPQGNIEAMNPENFRVRVRPQLRRRTRMFEAPLSNTNYALPVCPRVRVKPQLRRRTRLFEPPWGPFIFPAWTPENYRPRQKTTIPARHMNRRTYEPGWAQGAQPGGGGLLTRPITGVGL